MSNNAEKTQVDAPNAEQLKSKHEAAERQRKGSEMFHRFYEKAKALDLSHITDPEQAQAAIKNAMMEEAKNAFAGSNDDELESMVDFAVDFEQRISDIAKKTEKSIQDQKDALAKMEGQPDSDIKKKQVEKLHQLEAHVAMADRLHQATEATIQSVFAEQLRREQPEAAFDNQPTQPGWPPEQKKTAEELADEAAFAETLEKMRAMTKAGKNPMEEAFKKHEAQQQESDVFGKTVGELDPTAKAFDAKTLVEAEQPSFGSNQANIETVARTPKTIVERPNLAPQASASTNETTQVFQGAALNAAAEAAIVQAGQGEEARKAMVGTSTAQPGEREAVLAKVAEIEQARSQKTEKVDQRDVVTMKIQRPVKPGEPSLEGIVPDRTQSGPSLEGMGQPLPKEKSTVELMAEQRGKTLSVAEAYALAHPPEAEPVNQADLQEISTIIEQKPSRIKNLWKKFMDFAAKDGATSSDRVMGGGSNLIAERGSQADRYVYQQQRAEHEVQREDTLGFVDADVKKILALENAGVNGQLESSEIANLALKASDKLVEQYPELLKQANIEKSSSPDLTYNQIFKILNETTDKKLMLQMVQELNFRSHENAGVGTTPNIKKRFPEAAPTAQQAKVAEQGQDDMKKAA